MKHTHIITDLGFGDSGKGAITDRIASYHKSDNVVVVRYTGGSQAGHTVDLNEPGGTDPQLRHIHSSFASGALGGIPSHMSQFCPIYPQNLVREAAVLRDKNPEYNSKQNNTVDPLAPMITVYDVAWNRITQTNTNTVGIGIGATMERMLHSENRTFMIDVTHRHVLMHKLARVHDYYLTKIAATCPGKLNDFHAIAAREDLNPEDAWDFIEFRPTPWVLAKYDNVIFEGAQGIMLDQDHGFMPHVTWGYTTSRNAVEIINAYGRCTEVTTHHVTRAYQTRHGDGPMTVPVTDAITPNDLTNVTNPFQGALRVGELDVNLLAYAAAVDDAYLQQLQCRRNPMQLHVTCCDHLEADALLQVKRQLMQQIQLKGPTACWYGPTRRAIHSELELL